MPNINNQGVLFETINPDTDTAYIALSDSWFNIYTDAARKLCKQWNAHGEKEQQKVLGSNFYGWNYRLNDLAFYLKQIESTPYQDFKSIRLFKVQDALTASVSSLGEHFKDIDYKIRDVLSSRNRNPDLKTLFPKINFPIVRFRRAALPEFIYKGGINEPKIKFLVKQFDRPNTIAHFNSFVPTASFVKQKNLNELTGLDVLYADHLADLTAIIHHLIDINHLSINSIEDTLEQIIDDNLDLLSKLRPGFSIRPELTKKILLKKLI